MRFSLRRLLYWIIPILIAVAGGHGYLTHHQPRVNQNQPRTEQVQKQDQNSAANRNNSSQSMQNDSQQNASESQLAGLNFKSGSTGIVQVNNGQPTIQFKDFSQSKINYSQLDHLNRAGQATAYLTKQNLGRSAGRGRQVWKPTGWHNQPKYVNGKRIFPQNRGHLIAYTLTFNLNKNGHYQPGAMGSEDNPLNLATQSAYSNQVLMQVYEQQVRDALASGSKVIYQVTPVFRGSELMPRGYHLQAVSNNNKVHFNVYLENIQPGVEFFYNTGQSRVNPAVQVKEIQR